PACTVGGGKGAVPTPWPRRLRPGREPDRSIPNQRHAWSSRSVSASRSRTACFRHAQKAYAPAAPEELDRKHGRARIDHAGGDVDQIVLTQVDDGEPDREGPGEQERPQARVEARAVGGRNEGEG